MARGSRVGLPAVLADAASADRLAVEIQVAAGQIEGDGPLERDRRTFLARAAVQVANYGVDGAAHVQPEPSPAPSFRPAVVGDELETRTG